MKYALLLICILLSVPAAAQSFLNNPAFQQQQQGPFLQQQQQKPPVVNQYSDKYKGGSKVTLGGKKSLLPTGEYDVYFIRKPENGRSVVTLRVQGMAGVQGCASAEIPHATMTNRGQNLWITLQNPEIKTNADIRYPHYECESSGSMPSLDIDLSLETLENDNIEFIVMELENQKDRFKLHIDENSVELEPKSTSAFNFPHGSRFQFYPDNTVILSAPAIDSPSDAQKHIAAIAEKHGLTPLENAKSSPNKAYFTDESRALSRKLANKNTISLDTITIDDIFLGANGEYAVPQDIDIFASKPGEFD